MILVDHHTRLIQGLRLISLSPHLTQKLRQQAARHWTTPASDSDITTAAAAHQTKWPDLNAAARASIARCKAGQ